MCNGVLSCCCRSYVYKIGGASVVLLFKMTFENTKCVLSLQRLQTLNQVHFWDGQSFSFHTFRALSTFHISSICSHSYQTLQIFSFTLWNIQLLSPFLFLFSIRVIRFIQQYLQNSIKAISSATTFFLTSFKAKNDIHGSLAGSIMFSSLSGRRKNTRTTKQKIFSWRWSIIYQNANSQWLYLIFTAAMMRFIASLARSR